jgi:Tfp pilus assembly protein PilN
MIQLNLLPDVKLQYLKVKRTQQLVMTVSTVLIVASLAIFILLLGTVQVVQRKNIHDLNNDISTFTKQLQDTPDLNKVLTVQNQLKSLPDLHDQKAVADRLFVYLKQLTPSVASISQLSTDYTQHTITITGSAKSLDVVNTFVDTLKFTTYQKSGDSAATNAFSSVVLSQFSRNNAGASYTITLTYDPAIFDSANDIKLKVPKIISTRSAVEQPTDLFQKTTQPNAGNQ